MSNAAPVLLCLAGSSSALLHWAFREGYEMIEQLQLILKEAFGQDSISLYFLMFGGGLVASVTPCTYPVLPLTIGYIGNQAGPNRWSAFILSLSLVTGLATVYAILGGIVAAVGGAFGSIMGSGLVLYAIAMFYLIMGLFLLDVFHLPTPAFFSRLYAKSANSKGILGAFVIGGVSGLIVGPCTGPILAVALGAIALTLQSVHGVEYAQQILKGGILLFLFGFGQGALIILAGIFTGFMMRLPKAGAWLEVVKKGFALSIIIAASLLFVFVGQNTDFPSLTRFLASSEPSAASTQKPDTPAELKHGATTTPPATPAADVTLPSLRATTTPSATPAADATLPSVGATTAPSANSAADFTLPSLGGPPVTLSAYRGKKGVVLVFFATWCVNCMKELPEIKQFAEMAQRNNVIVFGINYKQSEELVKRFKESEQIAYGILLDMAGNVTTELFGIRGIPHVIGINAKGEVVYRGTALPDNKDEFIKNLEQGL
jgi:thiol:disulfide interchange protein DsbD